MFAVVQIAGSQFRVRKTRLFMFPRSTARPEIKWNFQKCCCPVQMANFRWKRRKAVIKAEILDQVQGDKVISFKMKRRKGFRKKHGHRTHYTKIKVTEIA